MLRIVRLLPLFALLACGPDPLIGHWSTPNASLPLNIANAPIAARYGAALVVSADKKFTLTLTVGVDILEVQLQATGTWSARGETLTLDLADLTSSTALVTVSDGSDGGKCVAIALVTGFSLCIPKAQRNVYDANATTLDTSLRLAVPTAGVTGSATPPIDAIIDLSFSREK